MRNISLSKITFLLLLLILIFISIVWDGSYKVENIFRVLLAVNVFFMIFEDKKKRSR